MVETKKKNENQYRTILRLSQEEKNYIEKICAISGYKYETVKNIFLSIASYATLDMYSGTEEINFPFLFKILVNKDRNSYEILPYAGLKNIQEKIAQNEDVWLEQYFIDLIRNQLNRMLDIHEG